MFVEHKEQGETKELDAARRLLLVAADLIDSRGLCQNGNYSDSRGALCIMGAIDVAAGLLPGDSSFSSSNPSCDQATLLVAGSLAPCISITEWNDQKQRTKEQVVSKLRAVALGLSG